jgi:hypothetical protein
MNHMLKQSKIEEIENIERLNDLFKKRVIRKEFPSVSFIAYLQYGIILADA